MFPGVEHESSEDSLSLTTPEAVGRRVLDPLRDINVAWGGRAAAKEVVGVLFKLIDSNGNGFIEEEEGKVYLRNIGAD